MLQRVFTVINQESGWKSSEVWLWANLVDASLAAVHSEPKLITDKTNTAQLSSAVFQFN